MTKKILLALAALTALTLCFSSCKKDNKGNNPTPTDVKLAVSPDNLTVMIGKTAALEIKTKPANAEYTCISKDPAIATVDKKGVITGVKVGETKVTVTAGAATKEVAVKVVDEKSTADDRLLGKTLPKGMEAMRDYIAPIYAPIFSQMKAQEEIVKAADTKEGWVFFRYDGDQANLNDRIYSCVAPSKDKTYSDKRMVSQVAYVHTSDQGNPQMHFYFKDLDGLTVFDVDPVKFPQGNNKLTEDEEKRLAICINILKLYGFTENPTQITFSNADGKGVGLYKKGLEGGSLFAILYAYTKKSDNKYHLFVQIEQSEPEKAQSATRMATMTRAFHPEVLQK